MKEELLNVKGATETVLLYRLELLAPCPMPSHPLFSALIIIITLSYHHSYNHNHHHH